MGDLIPFPGGKAKLTEEELKKFNEYREKMLNAKSTAEAVYYYHLAKDIIDQSKK